MKKIIIYSLSIFSVLLLNSGCSDSLDTDPTTDVSTGGMVGTAKDAMMEMNGIYRHMYSAGWSVSGNTYQASSVYNFNIMMDVMGEDLIMYQMGSGWFWYDCLYDVKDAYTSKSWRSWDIWNACYKQISTANLIIGARETMTGTEADKNQVIGAAYAIRAFYYNYLAQFFARTYVGHENDPCVPIYTEPTTKETKGQPRFTVDSVYTRAYDDINEAIRLLKDATPRNLSNQSEKTYIDYSVANGIKARIALTMEKWPEAKSAAAEARKNFSIGGSDQLMKGMNSASNNNIIWGAYIKSDQSNMYASFMSMMAVDGPYGRPGSASKLINKELYAKMGSKDIRRDWWNPDVVPPATESDPETPAYQQHKFQFSNRATWEADDIWMRAEEMLLIEAEAACMMNDDPTAQSLLRELMAKRDEDYTISKTGKDLGSLTSDVTGSLREEIINQRRIELWGEGFRLFDIRRLKQGFRRTTAMGWPSNTLIQGVNTQNPETYAWVFTIPQAEFDANSALDAIKDQNPIGDGL